MFGRRRHERDMEREFAFHLEREAIESGGADARRRAVLAFGGEEKWKEAARAERRGARGELWAREFRLAWRGLWRRPGFAALAIGILALGIGASTAMFSVVRTVLLDPLPFAQANRLVYIWSAGWSRHGHSVLSYPDFLDLRRAPGFTAMAAFTRQDMTLSGRGEPLHLNAEAVSANLFHLLGANPLAGRTFAAAEDRPGALAGSDAVVLSYTLAESKFGTATAAVGQSLTLDDRPYRVVGVMPPEFQFPLNAPEDLWTTIAPLTLSNDGPPMTAQRSARWMFAVGRLAPGVTMAAAQARLQAAGAVLSQRFPTDDRGETFRAQPMLAAYTGSSSAALWMLLAAVGCLLLIACVNVAGLLLARQARRREEFTLRRALGAGPAALVRQLSCESLLLGLLGAAGGLALAWAVLAALVPLAPATVVRLGHAGVDAVVLAAAVGLGLGAALLFGLAPALELARSERRAGLRAGLAESGRGATASPRRLRQLLVAAQFALALVVVAGALLALASLQRLASVPLGYQAAGVVSATLNLPDARYPTAAQQAAFLAHLRRQMLHSSAVAAAAGAVALPLQSRISTDVRDPAQGNRIAGNSMIDPVTPGFFRLLQIPLLRGRDFNGQDDHAHPPVAIVNQAFARQFLAGRAALGARILPEIASFDGDPRVRAIVGVVADTRQRLRQQDQPMIYLPDQQVPFDTLIVLLRPRPGAEAQAVAALRHITSGADIPVYDVRPLGALRARALAPAKFASSLLGVFAGLALLLAAAGLYGVMAQAVAERRRELAIRMALGAERGAVTGMVVREGLLLAAAGLAAGLAVAGLLSRVLRGLLDAQLYASSPLDAWLLLATAGILLAAAWLACALPARQAASADPATVLRSE